MKHLIYIPLLCILLPLKTYGGSNPEDTLSISGIIHQGTGFLNNGIIMAVNRSNYKVRIVRATSGGNFMLDSMPQGTYFLHAVPDPSKVTNYLPTYYVNKLNQNEAVTMDLIGHITDIDIFLATPAVSRTGNSVIFGRFSYMDDQDDNGTPYAYNWFNNTLNPATSIPINRNPCKNMVVLLYNSENKVIKSSVTDIEGYYRFSGLPGGTYRVEGHRAPFYTESSGFVSLNENSESHVNYRMMLLTLGLPENENSTAKNSFPNPFTDTLFTDAAGQITVTDAMGHVYYTSNHAGTIDTRLWPPGVYLLRSEKGPQKLVKR